MNSKEVCIKKAGKYFRKLPPANIPVGTLIRSVYQASRRIWGYENDYAMLMGYFDAQGDMHLFSGDQTRKTVTLTENDQLILFSNH